VVTRSVNGREFRHLTVICTPPPGDMHDSGNQ